MPDDMYPAAEATDETPNRKPESTETKTANSFLAPKRLIPDAKPGDTVTFHVEHIYEDEVELSVASAEEPEDEGEGEGEPETEMDAAMGRMDRMAS